MSSWQPGQPLLTDADCGAWQAWRKRSILDAQRHRRARYRRIDYYPSPEAAKVIDSLTGRYAGRDYSSVIDQLVLAGRSSGIK